MELYREASRILKQVEDRRGSIKGLTFSSRYKNKRQLYALVWETTKHNRILQQILDSTNIQSKERLIQEKHLARTLLYDFLFGKGLSGVDAAEKAVLRHSAELKCVAEKLKSEQGVEQLEHLSKASVVLPRYVRVNTLKIAVQSVIDQFVGEGYQLKVTSGLDYSSYLALVKELNDDEFAIDLDIPQLLVFSSGTEFHEHPLYKSGHIILQDKASCLPAIVLNPPKGSHVIDCCAAPGNKTTFMAALMDNIGTIFAFDLDRKRVATMKTLCQRAGALCIKIDNKDFFCVSPQDPQYQDVEYILVDPSCSGSGIVNRTPEFGAESGPSPSRLQSLASFQVKVLAHALSFPKAKCVVYSTCSIHKEENEEVVFEVLKRYKGIYGLKHILPSFTCRGDPEVFPDAVKCVSMNPNVSLTNGFFISCFERISKGTTCSRSKELSDNVREKRKQTAKCLSVLENDKEPVPRVQKKNKRRKMQQAQNQDSNSGIVKKQKVDGSFIKRDSNNFLKENDAELTTINANGVNLIHLAETAADETVKLSDNKTYQNKRKDCFKSNSDTKFSQGKDAIPKKKQNKSRRRKNHRPVTS